MLLQKIDNSWGIGPAAGTIAAVSIQNFNILKQAYRIRGITLLQGTASVVLALLFSLVGIGFVVWQMRRVLREDQGNQTMREIAGAIQVGASAFLRREYTYLTAFVVIVALVIAAFLNWQTALAFIVGAVISAATGYLGMYVAVRSNVRTAAAAVRSLNDGLRVAFASVRSWAWRWSASACWGCHSCTCSLAATSRTISPTSPALVSARPASPSLPVSAAASTPRQPTSAPTWWARSRPAFPRMTPATPP